MEGKCLYYKQGEFEQIQGDLKKIYEENKGKATAFKLKNGDVFYLNKFDSNFQYEDGKVYEVSHKGAMLYGIVNGLWARTGAVYTVEELSKKLMEVDS